MRKVKMMAVTLCVAAFSCFCASAAAPKTQSLHSPDGKIAVTVDLRGGIAYGISVDGVEVLAPSAISMTLSDGTVYGGEAKLVKSTTRSVRQTLDAIVYRKSKVEDNFNELTLKYKAFSIIFRAYDDGVAYRFVSSSKQPFNVASEQAAFTFPKDWNMYVPYVQQNDETLETQFHNSFENLYAHHKVTEWDKTHLAFLPLMVEADNGVKLCISESDLRHYPGMYLYNGDASLTLSSRYAPYPKERLCDQSPKNPWLIPMWVHGTEDYIAKCDPGCSFPWRLVAISRNDAQMADNDMVYRLATPQESSADFSWVKPGKVAWDWWNAWNIYGVDFKSGINTETYKYYIDFASANGIEYVILDEGWSPRPAADLLQVIPGLDLECLVEYGRQKNVGIILWAGFYPFQRNIEGICRHYSEMGVKGFKVDFMDSDDQQIPEFLETSAAIAAKYRLMLDFHGIYKPTGLSRTYPNVVNYEGIYGLEQMKWGAAASQVDYDVTVPFIRLFAGPADYTQGAMRNASKNNIRSVSSEAMSPGTRCRQLAEYVIFFSPLNMLCDSPSNYIREPECTKFIASVPTVWDETVALSGKLAEHIAMARRSGEDWYVGAMTNWDARDMTLDLSFIGEGEYELEIFRDGVNADKAARDYKKESASLPADRQLSIHMAPGGGFVARISKK